MKEEKSIYSMDINRIIKEYSEQDYAHKFNDPNNMDQFLERRKLPKSTQEEIDNLNRSMFIKEIETVINNLPKQKASGSLLNSFKPIRNK